MKQCRDQYRCITRLEEFRELTGESSVEITQWLKPETLCQGCQSVTVSQELSPQVIRGKRPGRVEMRRGRLEGASADVAVEDMAGEEWSAPQSSLRCTSP